VIDGDRRAFLQEFLHEEDIPGCLDSQMDVLKSDASILGIFGGNRAGKSAIMAVRRYIIATGELPLGLAGMGLTGGIFGNLRTDFRTCKRYRVVAIDEKQLVNTVLPTYKRWCPREWLRRGKWSESYVSKSKDGNNTLFLYKPGGDKERPVVSIEFLTNKQDVESFQGPSLDGLDYDEEPLEAIHKENLLRFGTSDKLDIAFGMTPTHGISWATELFDETMDSSGRKVELFKLVSLTNKLVNLSIMREILGEITSYEELKMRLLGEVISLSGLVYGSVFDMRTHVIAPFWEGLESHEREDYLCIGGFDPHLVTPTAGVFLLVDREGNKYVDTCYFENADTGQVKKDFSRIVGEKGYRMGWSVADKSSNSSIMAFGGRNIYQELSRGTGAIPSLRTSIKYEGSIRAGIDEMKILLKQAVNGDGPGLFIVDRKENAALIKSFRTLERDTYANEDVKGAKDKIKEGKHHLHAALRYIFQFPVAWYPAQDIIPEPEFFDEAAAW
jgi:phage terminase large subunit-like protein